LSLKDLAEFLSEDEKSGDNKFDWDTEKRMWLDAVDKLYKDIVLWLKPLTTSPNFKMTFENVVLHEEDLGEYETKRMILELKGQKAILEPLGTMVISSRGRIDLKGANGTVKFTLVDKRLNKPKVSVNIFTESDYKKHIEKAQGKIPEPKETIEYDWKIMTPPPNVQYLTLNEETFSDALLRVLRHG
jgi:hypothetical protein